MNQSIPPAIASELKAIRKEISGIKERLPDPDTTLTEEEKRLVKQSYENEKKGLLLSSEQLKARLRE